MRIDTGVSKRIGSLRFELLLLVLVFLSRCTQHSDLVGAVHFLIFDSERVSRVAKGKGVEGSILPQFGRGAPLGGSSTGKQRMVAGLCRRSGKGVFRWGVSEIVRYARTRKRYKNMKRGNQIESDLIRRSQSMRMPDLGAK